MARSGRRPFGRRPDRVVLCCRAPSRTLAEEGSQDGLRTEAGDRGDNTTYDRQGTLLRKPTAGSAWGATGACGCWSRCSLLMCSSKGARKKSSRPGQPGQAGRNHGGAAG